MKGSLPRINAMHADQERQNLTTDNPDQLREHLSSFKCQLVKRAKLKEPRRRSQLKEPSHVNDGWSAQHTFV